MAVWSWKGRNGIADRLRTWLVALLLIVVPAFGGVALAGCTSGDDDTNLENVAEGDDPVEEGSE